MLITIWSINRWICQIRLKGFNKILNFQDNLLTLKFMPNTRMTTDRLYSHNFNKDKIYRPYNFLHPSMIKIDKISIFRFKVKTLKPKILLIPSTLKTRLKMPITLNNNRIKQIMVNFLSKTLIILLALSYKIRVNQTCWDLNFLKGNSPKHMMQMVQFL